MQLRKHFPDATVRGFALVRTKDTPRIKQLFDPEEDGTITLDEDERLERNP